MFYSVDVPVPANTPESAPVLQELKLTAGVINRIEVQCPAGNQALLKSQIYYHEHQAWPTNPDGSFSADDYVIAFDEYFPLDEEPYTVKIKAWNLSTKLPHTVTVRIGVIRPEDVEKSSGFVSGLKNLLRLIGIQV
jgi:hypothetical protein